MANQQIITVVGICLNIPYDIYFKMLIVYIYTYNVEPAKQLSSFISLITRISIYIYISCHKHIIYI
jgi:hypothetical protein